MNNLANCPDSLLLSQFFDHELEAEEYEKIERHLKGCAKCRAREALHRKAEEEAQATLARSSYRPSAQTSSPDCLAPEVVSAYVHRLLSTEEAVWIEKHLQDCDRCVHEVKEALHIVSSLLATEKRDPVPLALKTRVAALWESQAEKARSVSLSRLVIQVTQNGLRFLEKRLVAPLVNVVEIPVPLPAYRAADEPRVLTLSITTSQAGMKVTAVQEGQGVALTLLTDKHEAQAGQRVFLRQRGRTVFSARTDSEGALRVPRLEPGIYEVTCPGMNIAFQLELRS
jgi:anti-sigma factor RsiW